MQRFDELSAAHFTGVAETCLNIARDVENNPGHHSEFKHPAVGGLVWDAVVAILSAIEIVARGNSAFVTGRASVLRSIIRRLEREHPELRITRLMRHAYAMHSLEHAGQLRRGSYAGTCRGAGRLLMALNSLLPPELRIEPQRFTWLTKLEVN